MEVGRAMAIPAMREGIKTRGYMTHHIKRGGAYSGQLLVNQSLHISAEGACERIGGRDGDSGHETFSWGFARDKELPSGANKPSFESFLGARRYKQDIRSADAVLRLPHSVDGALRVSETP
jgi:hypothetical protein